MINPLRHGGGAAGGQGRPPARAGGARQGPGFPRSWGLRGAGSRAPPPAAVPAARPQQAQVPPCCERARPLVSRCLLPSLLPPCAPGPELAAGAPPPPRSPPSPSGVPAPRPPPPGWGIPSAPLPVPHCSAAGWAWSKRKRRKWCHRWRSRQPQAFGVNFVRYTYLVFACAMLAALQTSYERAEPDAQPAPAALCSSPAQPRGGDSHTGPFPG